MSAPYGNLRSKLSRAIAAYLETFDTPAGVYTNISTHFSTSNQTYPNTTCRVVMGTPDPDVTGTYLAKVQIHIRGSAANVTATSYTDSLRAAFDLRVAATDDALKVSDNGQNFDKTARDITAAGRALATSTDPNIAANNADMVDFTCDMWNDGGFAEGNPDAAGCSWEEVLVFQARCCPKNVS